MEKILFPVGEDLWEPAVWQESGCIGSVPPMGPILLIRAGFTRTVYPGGPNRPPRERQSGEQVGVEPALAATEIYSIELIAVPVCSYYQCLQELRRSGKTAAESRRRPQNGLVRWARYISHSGKPPGVAEGKDRDGSASTHCYFRTVFPYSVQSLQTRYTAEQCPAVSGGRDYGNTGRRMKSSNSTFN